jgi:hypothetical protein
MLTPGIVSSVYFEAKAKAVTTSNFKMTEETGIPMATIVEDNMPLELKKEVLTSVLIALCKYKMNSEVS